MSIGAVSGSSQLLRSFQPPSFSSIDADGNGGISLDELKSAGPGKSGDAESAERAEKLFEAMDADGSGEISSAEKDAFESKIAEQRQAMQFMAQQLAGMPSNEDIFAATDKDSSGAISIEEFSSSEAAEGMSSDEIQELFSTIDSDGDGSITEAESSAFLDDVKEAMGGLPPPGGPPRSGEEEEDEDESSVALDLLSAATQAYGKTTSDDLLSMLASIFDEAA